MSEAGVTTTGLDEMRAAVESLTREHTLALRAVAWRTSRLVRERAQQLLRSQTHGSGATADAIHVIEQPERKQFVIESPAPAGRPANLPIWLEYGTRFMRARPYMRPALLEADDRYRAEIAAASAEAVREVLG